MKLRDKVRIIDVGCIPDRWKEEAKQDVYKVIRPPSRGIMLISNHKRIWCLYEKDVELVEEVTVT